MPVHVPRDRLDRINPKYGDYEGIKYTRSEYPEMIHDQMSAKVLPDGSHGYNRMVLDMLNKYRDSMERTIPNDIKPIKIYKSI